MEITLQDKNFRIGKLSALQQFYVFKRLSPVLPAIAIGIGSLKSFADSDRKEPLQTSSPRDNGRRMEDTAGRRRLAIAASYDRYVPI